MRGPYTLMPIAVCFSPLPRPPQTRRPDSQKNSQ
jgi:hypothetical protein